MIIETPTYSPAATAAYYAATCSVYFLETTTHSRRYYNCQNGRRAAHQLYCLALHAPSPKHPPPMKSRHKNAARTRITYRSGRNHCSSPTATYTTVLLRLPPTSPRLAAVAATAKSPNQAGGILSVLAAMTVATTLNCDAHGACVCLTTATSGGSLRPHFSIRDITRDEHHSQPPGHRVTPLHLGHFS